MCCMTMHMSIIKIMMVRSAKVCRLRIEENCYLYYQLTEGNGNQLDHQFYNHVFSIIWN